MRFRLICLYNKPLISLAYIEQRTIPEDDAKLLFALLDKDGSNQISEDEFMNFGRVMAVEFVRADSYQPYVEKHYPALFNSAGYQVRTFIELDCFAIYYRYTHGENRNFVRL